MPARSYARDATTWRAYQPHLPSDLRVDGDRMPREEWLAWRGLQVHLDRLDAAVREPSSGAPASVIVCHGGGGYGRLLAPFGLPLQQGGYDVVLPDLPGYGLTEVTPAAMRYGLWVGLVADLVGAEHARTGRPVGLVGLSMGGMLTLHAAALAAPGAVGAIVVTTLMDARDPATRAAVARFSGARHLAPLMPVAARVRVPMPWIADVGAMSSVAEVNALCRTDRQGGGTRVPLGFLHSWMTYRPALEPVDFDRCPVALMQPGADRWTPAPVSAGPFSQLPGSKHYVVLEGCEHFPIEEPGVSTLRAQALAFLAAHLS